MVRRLTILLPAMPLAEAIVTTRPCRAPTTRSPMSA